MGQATMFLSTHQATDCFGISARTLERYRGTGEGPVFYRFGRHVRYRQADLDDQAGKRRGTSTRDEGKDVGRRRDGASADRRVGRPGTGKACGGH